MTADNNDLAREERERLEKAERVRRLNVAIGRVLAGMKPPESDHTESAGHLTFEKSWMPLQTLKSGV